jgi:hypothetical protein
VYAFAASLSDSGVHCNVLELVWIWHSGFSVLVFLSVNVAFYPPEGVVSLECTTCRKDSARRLVAMEEIEREWPVARH